MKPLFYGATGEVVDYSQCRIDAINLRGDRKSGYHVEVRGRIENMYAIYRSSRTLTHADVLELAGGREMQCVPNAEREIARACTSMADAGRIWGFDPAKPNVSTGTFND